MKLPDFFYEKQYWDKGHYVIGVDEVGRGSFAGPVIAGAAAIKFKVQNSKFKINKKGLLREILQLRINDSKKLTARRREELDKEIRKFFHVGIGESSVSEINRYGIVKATEKAMRRAIKSLLSKFEIRSTNIEANSKRSENSNLNIVSDFDIRYSSFTRVFVLVDGFRVKYITGIGLKNQKAIIRGDSLSISIAAASIVAKVYRDRLMDTLSNRYTLYGWNSNKGYGTSLHLQAIKDYGICRFHKKQFVESFMRKFPYRDYL